MHGRHRRRTLSQLNLRNQTHRKPRPIRKLLQGQIRLMSHGANASTDLAVEMRLEIDEQAAVANRFTHDGENFFGLKRLLEIVKGGVLHGLDSRCNRGKAGRGDDTDIGIEITNRSERFRTTRLRRDVENDDLEAILSNLFWRTPRLGERGHSVALIREHLLQLKLYFFFMIDDENIQTLLIGHFGPPNSSIRL